MDGSGQVYMTIAELKEQEAQRRAGAFVMRYIRFPLNHGQRRSLRRLRHASRLLMTQDSMWQHCGRVATVRHNLEPSSNGAPAAVSPATAPDEATESDDELEGSSSANWSPERRTAEELVCGSPVEPWHRLLSPSEAAHMQIRVCFKGSIMVRRVLTLAICALGRWRSWWTCGRRRSTR